MERKATAIPLLLGKPGCGKSDACFQIGEALGIPAERTLRVHINNHDVVDFTGVPSVTDGITRFNPPAMFQQFAEGSGKGLIILEELPQSSIQHQTWAAGFMLDRETSSFKLDPEVRIIATGNRVEDKAGAKPLLSHLSDRLYTLQVETSLDDWCNWAIQNEIDPLGIAFLRFRPELLNDFDPLRPINPTQRSWVKVFTEIPTDLPPHLYLAACEAKVGEGAGAEWAGTREIMAEMPNIDAIRSNPTGTPVPTKPAVLYAVASALSTTATVEGFEADLTYMDRLPREFQMVYMSDVVNHHPHLQTTKAFANWAVLNQDLFA